MNPKTKFVIKVLIILFLISWLVSGIISGGVSETDFGNVALIEITGLIVVEPAGGAFGDQMVSSKTVVEFIQKADEDPSIKAILLDINSPGGSVVASKEIADAIERTDKFTYALIREVGASGAYWIASEADFIIANDLSITGSVGVIASYLEFAGLLERYNISYNRLVAGKYKDAGSPLKQMNDEERALIQSKIDKIHDYFAREVAENRDLPVETVKEVSQADVYLGLEAFDIGLVDFLGDMVDAKELIEMDLNETVDFVEFALPQSFFESLAGILSEQFFFVGKGIGSEIINIKPSSTIKITS